MSRRPPHVVKTVDLPSGTTLEVVQPAAGDAYMRVKVRAPEQDRDLCLCEECGSDLVEPIGWAAAGPARWHVELRCPNCERASAGVFSQECVDRLDERLDAATGAIVADLKRLECANMQADVERFIAALGADAILPEDF